MNRLLAFIIFVVIAFTANAQEMDSLNVQLAKKWKGSKTYALELANSMPEELYDFRPSPEEMTFREQLLHVADNMTWLSSTYLFVVAPTKQAKVAKLPKADLLKRLGEAFDLGLKAHSSVTKNQLDDQVKFFAGPMTRRQILILMHDHKTHHLGQLIVYLRLNGLKPPAYVGW